MTKLEEQILSGATTAQKKYMYMTGYWLDHAPEAFINTHVGLSAAGGEYFAYIDTSVKKLHADIDSPHTRGRKVKFEKERPDVAIWYKSKSRIYAIVETKKTYNSSPLKKDIIKLKKHLSHSKSAKYGYLLVHTTNGAKGESPENALIRLTAKLKRWEKHLGVLLVGHNVCKKTEAYFNEKTGRCWVWGIALYRYER
ncbi:hypothetical protein [Ferrovibrio sp.]|uniref:hypothetical protein n=1 Tax=Ferrovibrio sp. TaxID=1917215 RepID=UPI003D2DB550